MQCEPAAPGPTEAGAEPARVKRLRVQHRASPCQKCQYRNPCKDQHEKGRFWDSNTCQRCQWAPAARPAPVSAPITPSPAPAFVFEPPRTPPTVAKKLQTSSTEEVASACDADEVRCLQRQLAEMHIRMRGVADQIASIDDEADDTIARSKLSALRAHTDTLRGPRVCKKPEVAVLPVMDYFNSIKRAEDKVAMVLTLLKDIERTAHEEGQQVEVVTVMLRFVDARDRLSTMIQQTMKDYAIACMPLDNYITAILDHPTRLCERWRLEFARWMDFSRMLTRPEGVNSNKGMRYSPIVHKFNETVRFKVSENAYRELFPGAGNDPDSKLTTSLLGPSEFSVRASILLKKGTSKAGMVSDEQLATLLDSATVTNIPQVGRSRQVPNSAGLHRFNKRTIVERCLFRTRGGTERELI